MKSKQPEALRLADELERDKWHGPAVVMQAAADELRRLDSENEALQSELLELRNLKIRPPLSDLELAALGVKFFWQPDTPRVVQGCSGFRSRARYLVV